MSNSNNINILCNYNDFSFNIQIPPNESLYNLKSYIVKNLSAHNIYTYETNISIRYGFPPKLMSDSSNDTKTLPELNISNNECLRVDLIDPELKKFSENEIIDYSKYSIKKKSIPADNSCLFNSINFAINNNLNNPEIIRSIISSEILENQTEYNQAVLEKPPAEYAEWILYNDSWGGGIELSILSKYFNIKIAVVDIKNIIFEYFGEYDDIIYLLYNNVHYDVFYKEGVNEHPGVFKANDEKVKNEIMEICKLLQKHSEFIDTKMFNVKCMDCNFLMKGENDAIEHSKKTGHINFSQV